VIYILNILEMYQWEIFITLEIISVISLLLFGVFRYFFDKKRVSLMFIGLFIGLIMFEALLGWVLYQRTGVISNFQLVIIVFVVYAMTFGIADFKKLDRWMRKKVGSWRGIDLLTEKDKTIMKRDKDPKYIARKYRWSSFFHLVIFVTVQIIFLSYGTSSIDEMLAYLKDLSWVGTEDWTITPYANETIYGISMVWGIVFIADFIYSWSYTIFPSEKEG